MFRNVSHKACNLERFKGYIVVPHIFLVRFAQSPFLFSRDVPFWTLPHTNKGHDWRCTNMIWNKLYSRRILGCTVSTCGYPLGLQQLPLITYTWYVSFLLQFISNMYSRTIGDTKEVTRSSKWERDRQWSR